MDSVISFFDNMGVDFQQLIVVGLILLLGSLLLGLLGRFVFGKRSFLNNAVSSAISILFIYAVTVVLNALGAEFQRLVAPLPFVTIENDMLILLSFRDAHYTTLFSELLSMIILALLVNMADRWLPKGKHLFTWLFFRCLTVIISFVLHLIIVWLFTTYLPEGLVVYAPTVLLAILILLLLGGLLKLIISIFLTVVNPILGGLYTFFFSNLIGKQVTKAILTTAILAGLVYLLTQLGYGVISIASAALMAYVPFLLLLILVWYITFKLL